MPSRLMPIVFVLVFAGMALAFQESERQPPAQSVTLDQLPPPQRLGARVRAVEQTVRVLPIVVIVPDGPSYVEAIARWAPAVRYPVLLDDGTPEAREAIARFVAAFDPERVVQWRLEGAPPQWSSRERREAIEAAMLRAWRVTPGEGQQPVPALIEHWRGLEAPPPGVVVAGEGDSPWTATLALATARMQPIVWLGAPGGINQTIAEAEADAFCAALEASLDALGLQWRALGDEIDAVTLCMNAPARLETQNDGMVAFTARVGRLGSIRKSAPRWAWSGHVFGSSAITAVNAMASIFLNTPSAWLFESYPEDPPWSNYALAPAAEIYGQIGLDVVINEPASRGLAEFLDRSRAPVEAGFIAMNTKGRMSEFHLSPGRAAGRDVPVLRRPAALYVVHSFSAQRPGVSTSVAGSWFSRGAFAYTGSVDEPGLQSFVPQVTYAARLGSLFPFGAAGREDGMLENRKLAVFGDPLWMLDPRPRRRIEGQTALEGEVDLEDEAQEAIQAGDYGRAAWLLRMAGRNTTLVDFALATLRDEPGKVSADMAEASLHALFEAGERRGVAAMFARLPAERQTRPRIEDLAWHAFRPLLQDPQAAATMARLLSPHVRPQKIVDDTRELARALQSAGEAGEARSIVRVSLSRARTDAERSALESMLVSMGG
ncbi:MAG: hypothetical protein ACFCBV_00655 [Phycisphaerales bacterium]